VVGDEDLNRPSTGVRGAAQQQRIADRDAKRLGQVLPRDNRLHATPPVPEPYPELVLQQGIQRLLAEIVME